MIEDGLLMAGLLSLSLCTSVTANVLLFLVNPLGMFLLCAKICFCLSGTMTFSDFILITFFSMRGDSKKRFCDFVLIHF